MTPMHTIPNSHRQLLLISQPSLTTGKREKKGNGMKPVPMSPGMATVRKSKEPFQILL
jgi:hypothetical protein